MFIWEIQGGRLLCNIKNELIELISFNIQINLAIELGNKTCDLS